MYIWEHKNWSEFSWDNDKLIDLLSKARFHQGSLLSKMKSINFDLQQQAHSQILVEEIIKTSEIEGEHFNRDSVCSSVAHRLGVEYAGAWPVDRRAEGIIEMLLDVVEKAQQPLTLERLNSWHHALFSVGYPTLYEINIGKLRGDSLMRIVSGPITKQKVHYIAPPRDVLEGETEKFLLWFNSENKVDSILKAAIAHLWFVVLHPYDDGNGRLSRALAEMVMANDEGIQIRSYSLSSAIMQHRKEYYDILEKTSKGSGEITEWLQWFLQIYIKAVEQSENIIENVLDKHAFWTKISMLQLNEKQKKVINKLLEAGRDGFKGNLNRRKYMGITKTSSATATREITDLVAKKVLVQLPGKGRSTAYTMNWDLL